MSVEYDYKEESVTVQGELAGHIGIECSVISEGKLRHQVPWVSRKMNAAKSSIKDWLFAGCLRQKNSKLGFVLRSS